MVFKLLPLYTKVKSCTLLFFFLCMFLIYVTLRVSLNSNQSEFHIVPKYLRIYLTFNESGRVGTNLTNKELALEVEKRNSRPEIYNLKKYGTVEKDTPFVIIQVHKDAERLQYLIVSLGQVRFIQNVLLIFSHSYYDDKLNVLIRSINFCKVMQIFYPYSLQLHPNKFPGVDPTDCRNAKTSQNSECIPRDAHATEHKQHWWWKANFVFTNLKWSLLHIGMVIFLEEDNYVASDLLYMLRYFEKSLSYCSEVHVLSFGGAYSRGLSPSLLTLAAWRPLYDKGIAFNITTWRKIAALSSYYCMFDDCSWSRSLLNLFDNFHGGRADMIASIVPRVLSTAESASGREGAEAVWKHLQKATLFPDTVKVAYLYGPTGRIDKVIKAAKGNGGWSDLRDQLLCINTVPVTNFPWQLDDTLSFGNYYS